MRAPTLLARVDRLVLNEIIGPFLFSTLLFSTLFFAADDLQKIFVFVQNGQSLFAALKLVLYALPMILAFTIPMAMLLATLLGYGRLSADSEIVALTASGTSVWRIIAPAVAFSVAVAVPVIIANQTLVPAGVKARQALIDDLKKNINLSGRGAFDYSFNVDGGGRIALHAEGGVRFGENGYATMRGVTLTMFRDGLARYTVNAEGARWKVDSKTWELTGDIWSASADPALLLFGQQVATREYALKPPDELQALERPVNEIGSDLLRQRSKLLYEAGRVADARSAEMEVARRVSFPIATVVFAFVGAPLGIQPPRSGRGAGFGLSILITFLYWTLTQALQSVGRGGVLPTNLAAHLPNVIGIIAGIVLTRRLAK